MKIQIRDGRHCFTIPLPNALVFNPFVLKIALRKSGSPLPPEAVERLAREFRRLSQRKEPWELVRMEGKNGEIVSITF